MLASSSRHAFNACSRSSSTKRSLKDVSSAWLASSSRSPTGVRNSSSRSAVIRDTGSSSGYFARTSRFALRQRPRPSSQVLQVWKTQDEDRFNIKRGAQCAEFNIAMRDFLSRGKVEKVLEQVLLMKRANVRPDLTTYSTLLQALASEKLRQEAWAAFRDMIVMGIEPDANIFNHLLYAHRDQNSDKIHNILDEMDKHGVKPNTRTYDFLINYYLDSDNLEMALLKLAEMNDLGFSPSLKVAKNLSYTAGQDGHAHLALELADAYEETTIRRLDSEAWVNILIHSAEQLYAEGVLRCWKKVVTDLRILVDEGLCQLVLHTAARHGLPVLASEAIRQLEAIGVQYQEYHFSPMLDAFVKNQQLKEAFSVLDLMRQARVNPTIYSADSILHAIKHDPELIDGAYALLEELHKEGSTVDVIAVNVLIKACAMLNDLQRAVGTYKTMSSLGVQPDAETYEMLLKACRAARHVELGERLFNEMREAGLNPTARSFERLISLVLTQTDYENAFFYLEEMKVSGHTPSYVTYEDIVKKCVSASDGRYKLAVEELKQTGYRVSGRLQKFIDSGGQEWKEQVSDEEKLPFETRKRIWEMGVAQEAAQT